MTATAFEETLLDSFNPDTFHCPECEHDSPIEFVLYDGYLYKCPYCNNWQESD